MRHLELAVLALCTTLAAVTGCTAEQQEAAKQQADAALEKLEEGAQVAQKKAGELRKGAGDALDSASEGLEQAKQVYNPATRIEPVQGAAESIRCEDGRCTVASEFADKVRRDPTTITQGVTIMPRFGKAGVDGLYLVSVPEGSVAHFLGLRTGDTVKSVAGEPLTSLDAAQKLAKKVNKRREVEVVYERQGSDTTVVLVLEKPAASSKK